MMLSVSYPVYSVPCMFTNNDKDNQVKEYNIMHISLGFAVYNNHPCPWVPPWSQVLIEQWDCKIGNYYVALSLQQ